MLPVSNVVKKNIGTSQCKSLTLISTTEIRYILSKLMRICYINMHVLKKYPVLLNNKGTETDTNDFYCKIISYN